MHTFCQVESSDDVIQRIEQERTHFFVTWKAGVGKSTVIHSLRKRAKKNYLCLAFTGVAALHIDGQTIHSFFGFNQKTTIKNARVTKKESRELLAHIDAIIIDEISFVRADLLDMIDTALRRELDAHKSFGGLQIIFVGDPYQLAPIVNEAETVFFETVYTSPYFFAARAYQHAEVHTMELTHVYRQKEWVFLDLLNRARVGAMTSADVQVLSQRVARHRVFPEGTVFISPRKKRVADINTHFLEKIQTEPIVFIADIHGDVGERDFPADREVVLKPWAQVMMVINDADGQYANGTVWIVDSLDIEAQEVVVRLREDVLVTVVRTTWEVYKTVYNEEKRTLAQEKVGSFSQMPLILAWAVTIHKSQGKTFESVCIDTQWMFAEGQAYVALSRAKTFEWVFLLAPCTLRDVRVSPHVQAFFTDLELGKFPVDWQKFSTSVVEAVLFDE